MTKMYVYNFKTALQSINMGRGKWKNIPYAWGLVSSDEYNCKSTPSTTQFQHSLHTLSSTMSKAVSWTAEADRALLLYVIGCTPKMHTMTGADWEKYADHLNDGRKGDAFRKRYAWLRGNATVNTPEGVHPPEANTKSTIQPVSQVNCRESKIR
jgi:hypothetical protein